MHTLARRLAIATLVMLVTAMLPRAVPAGPPGTWTRIGPKIGTGLSGPAIARTADGVLHVVWAVDGPTDSYRHAAVGVNGKSVGSLTTVLSKWSSVIHDPALIIDGDKLRLVFSGIKGPSNDPYSRGAMYTTTSDASGKKWTLFNGSMSKNSYAYASYGTGATLDMNLVPVATWCLNSDIWWHVGVDPSIPSTVNDGILPVNGGSILHTAIATDAVTGGVYVAYYNQGTKGNGTFAKQILPTRGPTKKAPASTSNGSSLEPGQNLALSARRGVAGVYLAYGVGYPSTASVRLWKLGTNSTLTAPSSADSDVIALASTPDGGLWIVWHRNDTNKVYTARTDPNVTAFVQLTETDPPANTADVYRIAADASKGTLDIVLNALAWDSTNSIWHTQVVPE